jgi:hypothetical protein
VETDLLANDLKQKYNLPGTAAYDDFMKQKIVNFSKIISNFIKLQHLIILIGKMLIPRIDTCLLGTLAMAFTTKCTNVKCIIQKLQKIVNVNFAMKILTTTISLCVQQRIVQLCLN